MKTLILATILSLCGCATVERSPMAPSQPLSKRDSAELILQKLYKNRTIRDNQYCEDFVELTLQQIAKHDTMQAIPENCFNH